MFEYLQTLTFDFCFMSVNLSSNSFIFKVMFMKLSSVPELWTCADNLHFIHIQTVCTEALRLDWYLNFYMIRATNERSVTTGRGDTLDIPAAELSCKKVALISL